MPENDSRTMLSCIALTPIGPPGRRLAEIGDPVTLIERDALALISIGAVELAMPLAEAPPSGIVEAVAMLPGAPMTAPTAGIPAEGKPTPAAAPAPRQAKHAAPRQARRAKPAKGQTS